MISKKWAKEEYDIIDRKYKSKPFCQLSPDKLINTTALLLLKINIITGWPIPKDEARLVLIDQFSKKLVESYPLCNEDEVEYAFRQNSSIKDWGRDMSLSLIDQVMIPYMNKRFELSFLEEKERVTLSLPAPDYKEINWREVIQIEYDLFLSNRSDSTMWPAKDMYNQLVEDELIVPGCETVECMRKSIYLFFIDRRKKEKPVYEKIIPL